MANFQVFKVLVLSLLIHGFVPAFGQQISSETVAAIKLLERTNPATVGLLTQRGLPIRSIQGNNYISMVALINDRFKASDVLDIGAIIGTHRPPIVTLQVPIEEVDLLIKYQGFEYVKISSKARPHLERAVRDVRADSVHQGIDLPQAYTGKDVLIGVTDWGFDYTHPMFYDTALVETRILAAWDQYKQSGPAPVGYSYGTEYMGHSALLTAESDTSNIYTYATHGTHVAGIAGGSGAGTKYQGVAFDAKFLFATFLVDEGAVLDAFEWMYQKSLEEEKRLVINMSWGLYYFGTLDGNSVVSQAIDVYSALGVIFVTSGGNNGDADFHIEYDFNNDTLRSRIGFVPNNAVANQDGQSITAWGEEGENFEISFEVLDASNNLRGASSIFQTNNAAAYTEEDLIIGTDTLHYDVSIDSAHPLNNRPHARLRIDFPPIGNKIVLKATAEDGVVHFWNLLETTTGVGNTGWDFSSLGSGYVEGDRNYGVGEPACTKSLITVGAYQAGVFTNGAFLPFGISGFSSIGPTLDGRIKPDITAPGAGVISSISSFTDRSYTPNTTVQFNGREYGFVGFSGTSMSSPMVAGIVALMLEANPDLTPQMVKDILIETAREDVHTGTLPVAGDEQWGHGKVQAYFAVQRALELVGVDELNAAEPLVKVFPNPANESLYFQSDREIKQVLIMDIQGQVLSNHYNPKTETITLEGLAPGIYLALFETNDFEYLVKFTKL